MTIILGVIKLVTPATYPWFDWNPFALSVFLPLFWGTFGGVVILLVIAAVGAIALGVVALCSAGYSAIFGTPAQRVFRDRQRRINAEIKIKEAVARDMQKKKQRADRKKATLAEATKYPADRDERGSYGQGKYQ